MLPPRRREFKDIYVVFELMKSDVHGVIKTDDDLTPEDYEYFIYQLLRGLERKLSKDDVRDLIYKEILKYHPQMLDEYLHGGEPTPFINTIDSVLSFERAAIAIVKICMQSGQFSTFLRSKLIAMNHLKKKNDLLSEFFTEYGDANGYQIQEICGKGSYGVVCSAIDSQTDERVAVKKIKMFLRMYLMQLEY
ncbi:hypothetical protein V2J09_019410 [Rumex salicifolius]